MAEGEARSLTNSWNF